MAGPDDRLWPQDAEHRKSLVRECVIGIAADVGAIKLRHAELAGWSAAAADADHPEPE